MRAIPEQIGRLENRIEDRGRRSEVRSQRSEVGREKDEHRTSNVQHRMLNEKKETEARRSEGRKIRR